MTHQIDEPVSLGRALVAVFMLELDKQIEKKFYTSRRDFALRCLDSIYFDPYGSLQKLVRGQPTRGLVPKLDADVAHAIAKGLQLELSMAVLMAQNMISSGTFPHGDIANKHPIRVRRKS